MSISKNYKQISITRLILNPENDRFESVENEKLALETMLNKLGSKIYVLALDIVKRGLSPKPFYVVPYYNKPSQEGIYQHYKAIAEATELPIVLYNVPGRTGVNMTAETTLRIARDFNNVIAIKEASGNITQMDDIIKNKPENFNVISGDDGITFPLITLGAVGVISVIGNAFPREFSRMTRLALQGDFANALTIHHKFTELFNLLFVDGNPAGVKSMLNAMGMIENKLRLPLVPTRITTFEAIRKVLNELNIKC